MKRHFCMVATFLFALATQSSAHEFWLEPKNFQADAGSTIEIDLRNGQDFKGVDLSWYDPRIESAVVATGDDVTPYKGLPGDLPGMTVTPGPGLTTVAYAARMSRLTYDSWDKVLSFTTHKDVPDFEARHAARGLPQEGVTEGYWRYSKTLITGPDTQGADRDTGMETEFVALTNPYTENLNEMRLRLIYQGTPRTDAQVEMWEKAGDTVTKTLHRTDAEGIVTLPARPGHSYMVDSVVLRDPTSSAAKDAGVMWETLWANMTFAVPE